jgi:hypothetical protein
MPTRRVKEQLAQDVASWQADGLISASEAATLNARWHAPGFGLGMLVKYVGIVGGVLVGLGILSMFAALAESEFFAALVAGGLSIGLFRVGLHLSVDPEDRYPHSSKVILAVAVLALGGAAALLMHFAGFDPLTMTILVGAVAIPITVFLAYRYRNIFLLILALLQFFHWVGSFTTMLGRSSYAIQVQDPVLMAVAAALVVGVGVYHERALTEHTGRFYYAYQALGLVYFNLSLLILTVFSAATVVYIGGFGLAGLGQIMLGARLKNGLVLGFGVTAVAVNIFTRYFEAAWAELDAGVFFLIAGTALFGSALVCERYLRRASGDPA